MARFAVPGVLISLLGAFWVLQGSAGKSSAAAAIGVVAIVCGIALVVLGWRRQAKR